ncbi:MAG TPA: L-serine ammonia-lyase, iron-sulfur-dependent, subunit alpha [archaeon]|nr:L-serine ammonia-lyase, iron-sulfur-dependent, subunit alpha [archaeon]
MNEILEKAVKERRSIHEVTLEFEREQQGKSREEILAEMRKIAHVMTCAAAKGVSEEITTKSGLVRGSAKKYFSSLRQRENPLTGRIVSKALAYSLAVAEVNASMGLVVAAPTAGSCGVLPGALLALNEEVDSSEEKMLNGLLTASGIGLFIAERATFAASVAGCAAEIGASASMAAASIVEFYNGSAEQAINAGAISLKSCLGLVCDPVAGLVEVPCIKRNAIGVANSFAAAEMALNGVESAVPFDEVVGAMYRIGKRIPSELRETSRGGLAMTPTALKVRSRFL